MTQTDGSLDYKDLGSKLLLLNSCWFETVQFLISNKIKVIR